MSYRDLLRPMLKRHEGVKPHPYKDTKGILTIGVGRNLDAVGLRPKEIDFLFENDIDDAEGLARTLVQNFDSLTPPRQGVMVDMAFNLGEKLAEFTQTLSAVRDGRYDDAAVHMLDSAWAMEVKGRATELAEIMRTGAS